MKLIIGLGNPEKRYDGTRHNVGFAVLDSLAKSASFTPKTKFFADIAEVTIGDEKVLLVKPTTYYNETGRSVRALLDFYKLAPESSVLVVHDDLALPFGTLRTREKGSDAGNNGIKSVNAHIGESYARLRIGILNDLRTVMDDADFVLAKFSKAEADTLKTTILPKTGEIITAFICGTHEITSHSLTPKTD